MIELCFDLGKSSLQFRICATNVVGAAPRYVEATKTISSRRKLSVPQFLIDELQDHLSEAPQSEFVSRPWSGHPLRRNNSRRRYWLPALELHFASMISDTPVPAADRPGSREGDPGPPRPASITTTMNVYGHLLLSLDERLVQGLEEVYRKAKGAR